MPAYGGHRSPDGNAHMPDRRIFEGPGADVVGWAGESPVAKARVPTVFGAATVRRFGVRAHARGARTGVSYTGRHDAAYECAFGDYHGAGDVDAKSFPLVGPVAVGPQAAHHDSARNCRSHTSATSHASAVVPTIVIPT